jgi:hypothetical protein
MNRFLFIKSMIKFFFLPKKKVKNRHRQFLKQQ